MLSLVIPTYNEKKSLQILLPRLQDIISQISTPVEFIVVDDNSPDGTAEFASEFPLEGGVIRVGAATRKAGSRVGCHRGLENGTRNTLGCY